MDNVSGGSRPYLKQLNKREQRWAPWDSEKAPRMARFWRATYSVAAAGDWFNVADVEAALPDHGMQRNTTNAIVRHAWKLNLIQKHASRRGEPVYRIARDRTREGDWRIETGVRSTSDRTRSRA